MSASCTCCGEDPHCLCDAGKVRGKVPDSVGAWSCQLSNGDWWAVVVLPGHVVDDDGRTYNVESYNHIVTIDESIVAWGRKLEPGPAQGS